MTEDLRGYLEEFADRFDFGEYETAAYLTIIEHGDLTATELSELTDIPQPRVYDTVRDLAEHGFVELNESRPMRVRAVDPREAFSGVQSSLDDLIAGLADRYTAPARQSEAVSLIKSRATILRYLGDVIETAEYELLVALSPSLLERFEDELAAQKQAGVAIELLVAPADEAPAPDEYDYGAVADEVRARRGITSPILAVADGRDSIYATKEAISGQNDRYGVVFNRSELGFLVSGFFNIVLWSTAREAIDAPGDRPFPRRYATMRRCVSDIQSLEGQFYASIAGREVETGNQQIIEGRIVEATFSEGREVATLRILTDDGPVTIGGQVASLEDIEAHEIRVGRDEPPGL